MKTILAFTGRKGSGKSTIAQALKTNNPAFKSAVILSFAEPLKRMAKEILQADAFLTENKEKTEYGLCGKTPRIILQTLGTEWGRNCVGEGIWTEIMKNRLLSASTPQLVLIDDLRFENEALMLKKFPNTYIIQVDRYLAETTTDPHPSERGIPSNLIDLKLLNNSQAKIKKICRNWTLGLDSPLKL